MLDIETYHDKHYFKNTKSNSRFSANIQSLATGMTFIAQKFHQLEITSKNALDLSKKLGTLSFEKPSPDKAVKELGGLVHMFEKHVESEQTEVPHLFVCQGCGMHLFLTTEKHVIATPLYSKEVARLALEASLHENAIGGTDYVRLSSELEEIEFPGELQDIDLMIRGITPPAAIAIAPKKLS